jgi:hypothetical protein
MSSKMVREVIHHHAFKAALLKVAAARRRLRRGRKKHIRQTWLPSPAPSQLDPVKIAVLAMGSLGRASVRAAFTGIEVRVAVPDDATAEIFRAALSETVRSRPTDRLVRIVVE